MGNLPIRRALISVSDKNGLVGFAKALLRHGVEIISTGGTARLLGENEIPHRLVSDVTSHPEILDGRVKSLHPKIHGGILANRSEPSHMAELEAHRIDPIDLVVCNLYPFSETIADRECSFEAAIENIDIGGPCMLRAAAKNHQSVAVVVEPDDYGATIAELDANAGAVSDATRRWLARKAFHHTANYDRLICNYLDENTKFLPEQIHVQLEKICDLRYGENPHQMAALYRDPNDHGLGVLDATQYQGKALSYNNYIDMEAALDIVRAFDEPAAVVVKHTNPCGAGVSTKGLLDAYDKARATDPVSAFGGIVGVNEIVDVSLAAALIETFLEVIIAPGYTEEALSVFKKKKNLRVMAVPFSKGAAPDGGQAWTRLRGGVLVQERDRAVSSRAEWKVVSTRQPSEDEWRALEFGWTVARFVKSNAIVYSAADRTLGIGAGQMSRVDASRLAVTKAADAKLSLVGSAVASDAFFPFRDAVDAAAEAGALAIIEPGGSIRDSEVIAAANQRGMALVFTGHRHFRH